MKKALLSVLLASSFVANAQFWTEKATGFATPARTSNSISIVDANVIWANEFDNASQDYTLKGFTLSTNGGESWTPGSIDLGPNTAGLGISSITAASDLIAWVSTYPETGDLGGVWKTTDGGITWAQQTTALFNNPIESYANCVYFWDANNGIALGDPESGEFEIYTTNDGGSNWTRVDGANIPDPDIAGEFGIFNRYTFSGNSIWFGTDLGRIYRSTDNGLNWTVVTSPAGTDFWFDRLTFSDTNKGLLMQYYDTTTLYKTIDGGDTWNPVTTSGFYNTDIAYIPGTSIIVSASTANPLGSSYSTDDGTTWIAIDGVSHGTLAFLNSSFGFSAGETINSTTGGIFKFTGIPLKTPNFDIKNQISFYPNPTNGILHLDSEKSLIKQATVFDLLGRQVFDSKFSALNKANLDLKSLQTGAYVLKVTSDTGKTETMKIMKN